MGTDPALWAPGSFCRRPEWRWLRAGHLAATGRRRDPRVDDGWVARRRDAVRGRGGPRSKAGAVRAARDVWAGGPGELRWELEARLLTADPLAAVAERCGLPAAAARAYGEVFFAVRPVLRASDWVLARAVGYGSLTGFTSPQPGGVWKYAAYVGGPVVLDAVVAATTGRPLPAGLVNGTGPERAFDEARVRLATRLWVALVTAATDAEVARAVDGRRRLRDLVADITGRTDVVPPAVAVMEEFLMALPSPGRAARTAGPAADGSR